MNWTYLLTVAVFVMVANLLAGLFLGKITTRYSVVRSALLTIVRWVAIAVGLGLLYVLGVQLITLGFIALFAVSAGVDFESTYLPPDWFVYGCVVLNIVVAAMQGGEVLRGVIVTQAICFGLAVFLAYLGA